MPDDETSAPAITPKLIELQQEADRAIAATIGGGDDHIAKTAAAAKTVQALYDALDEVVPAASGKKRLEVQDELRAVARGE